MHPVPCSKRTMNRRRPHRVLAIDDDAEVRHALGELLEAHGFETISAPHGAEGLRILREGVARGEPCDVVIVDVQMPVMDGHRFVRELRADPSLTHLPVVVFSSDTSHVDGATAMVRKLSSTYSLIRTVRALVDMP